MAWCWVKRVPVFVILSVIDLKYFNMDVKVINSYVNFLLYPNWGCLLIEAPHSGVVG